MEELRLGVVEGRFANLLWECVPLTSGELVRICEEELNWKKSTTYTVLKKLCDRGIFKNEHGKITALMTREKYYSLQCRKFVDKNFDGSLPAFLTAFAGSSRISTRDIQEIRELLDSIEKK